MVVPADDAERRSATETNQLSSENRRSADEGGQNVSNGPLSFTQQELREIYDGIDEDELRQILEETRPSIERYADILSDIDDKAARTLRLNTVIFGFLLTFAGIVTSTPNGQFAALSQYVNAAYGLGLTASAISATLALITYTQSEVITGFSIADVASVFEEELDDRIDMNPKILLFNRVRSHVQWLRMNRSVNRRDSNMLFASHGFLFISLGNYSLAVLWVSFGLSGSPILLGICAIVLSISLGYVVALPKTNAWDQLAKWWRSVDGRLDRFRR